MRTGYARARGSPSAVGRRRLRVPYLNVPLPALSFHLCTQPRDFVEVVSARLPDLFDSLLDDKDAMQVRVGAQTPYF